MPIISNCDNCKKEIKRKPSQFKKHKNHFCSNKCKNIYLIGKKNDKSSETMKRLIKEGKLNPTKNLGDYTEKGKYSRENSMHYGKERTEETKKKLRKFRLGKSYEDLYGKKKAEEVRIKVGLASKDRIFSEEHCRKIGESNKGKIVTNETKNKMKENHWSRNTKREEVLKKIINPISSLKKSISQRKLWKNPEHYKKHMSLMMKGESIRPNSYEKKISDLCINNNLPFIYTGDGTFLIGRKNPDFVNKEERIVIEVFCNYFKIRDYGSVENYIKVRSEYFTKYGYKTIFINEEEVCNRNWEQICLNKIQ